MKVGCSRLDDYQLKIVEEHLEMIQMALRYSATSSLHMLGDGKMTGLTLVIMPRTVKEVLKEHVFSYKMPIVFSSATLSVDGSFDYVADSLGIETVSVLLG